MTPSIHNTYNYLYDIVYEHMPTTYSITVMDDPVSRGFIIIHRDSDLKELRFEISYREWMLDRPSVTRKILHDLGHEDPWSLDFPRETLPRTSGVLTPRPGYTLYQPWPWFFIFVVILIAAAVIAWMRGEL